MRTKALLLGAHPEPIEGPWVDIGERRSWRCVGMGFGANGDDAIVVEANYGDGVKTLHPLRKEKKPIEIEGALAVRAVIQKPFHSPHLVTVYVEENI